MTAVAKFSMVGEEAMDMLSRLDDSMRREGIRRIVEAGGAASAAEMSKIIQNAHHVRTGQMLASVAPGEYQEFFGGGAINIYPQGTDSRGVSNALKAFVTNYGIGRNPTKKGRPNRTGDKFITSEERVTDSVVAQAMQAEADRIAEEFN